MRGSRYRRAITVTKNSPLSDLTLAHLEAVHDLINLHIYPQCTLRLGQSDRYPFAGADIVLERTGNPYGLGKDAVTYRYAVDGCGFGLSLLATWDDLDQATADVRVVAVSPNDDAAVEALQEWLAVVTANMLPRDQHAGLMPGSTVPASIGTVGQT